MANKSKGKAVPIAFISENKLQFSAENLRDIFEKVGTRPVSVVSVNGSPTAEKSYLLRQFLNFLSNYGDRQWFMNKNCLDFQWENSAVTQTPGISIWSEPIIIKKSGEEVAVLFMNAQGCFDGKTSTPEDLLIFALSFVLSSNFVYCVSDKLSEELLQFFQLFVGYATGSIDLETTESFFELIFVIKEGQIPGYYEHGYHDSSTNPGTKNILHDLLRINHEEAGEFQFNHQITLASFKKIACCLLPGEDLYSYDVNHNLPSSFVETMKDIVPRVLHPSNVYIKRIGDHKFKGRDLLKLFDQLSILLTKNEIPLYKNVNEYTAQVQSLLSLLNGSNYYRWVMDKMMSTEPYLTEEQLKKLHDESMETTMTDFNNKKSIDYDIIWSRRQSKLEEMVQNSYNFFIQVNGVKLDYSKIKNQTPQVKDEMEKRIRELKNNFPNPLKDLNRDFKNVVGLDLEGLTDTVRNVFGQNARNGH